MMPQIQLALASAAVFISTGGHASPSFDCNKAATPVEILICGSPELAELDQKLGDIFRAKIGSSSGDEKASLLNRQCAWLSGRATACRVPEKQGELSIGEWNAMAGCVVRLYQERLAELQLRQNASVPAIDASELIHPLCLRKVLKSNWNEDPPKQESFAIRECAAEYADVPVQISDGKISAHDPIEPLFYDYKPVALLPDGRQLIIVHDGGGSGTGSQVATIRRADENRAIAVHGVTIFRGSDRCDGYISAAAPSGSDVSVALAVSPDAFFRYAGLIGPSGASSRYQDCVGTIRLQTSLEPDNDRKATEVVSGTVDSEASHLSDSAGNHCFDKAVAALPGSLPKTFDHKALDHLVKIYKTCISKEHPG